MIGRVLDVGDKIIVFETLGEYFLPISNVNNPGLSILHLRRLVDFRGVSR